MRVLRAAAAAGERARLGRQALEQLLERLLRLRVAVLAQEDPPDLGVRASWPGSWSSIRAAARAPVRPCHCAAIVRASQSVASASSGSASSARAAGSRGPPGRRASSCASQSRGYTSRPIAGCSPSARRNRPDAFFQLALAQALVAEREIRLGAVGILRERALERAPRLGRRRRARRARARGRSRGARAPCASPGRARRSGCASAIAPSQSPLSMLDALERAQRLQVLRLELQEILERRARALQEAARAEIEREPEQRLAAQLFGDVGPQQQVLVDLDRAADVAAQPVQVREREIHVRRRRVDARGLGELRLGGRTDRRPAPGAARCAAVPSVCAPARSSSRVPAQPVAQARPSARSTASSASLAIGRVRRPWTSCSSCAMRLVCRRDWSFSRTSGQVVRSIVAAAPDDRRGDHRGPQLRRPLEERQRHHDDVVVADHDVRREAPRAGLRPRSQPRFSSLRPPPRTPAASSSSVRSMWVGITRISPTVVMKFTSPLQRGTRWKCT